MAASPFIIVAIDGGAAAGKSSVARALSSRFDLLHADTGAHYRAVTAEMLRRGVSPAEPGAVAAALRHLKFGTKVHGKTAHFMIGDWVPGEEIRRKEVNEAVSLFAAIPAVRTALLDYQRGQAEVARGNGFRGLVMEGRDIGTVIFPKADFRFFLHADPLERAARRAREGRQDPVAERDRIDSSRKTAPLACPPGATSVDTTHLSLPEVVERLAQPIAEALAAK